MQVRFLFYDLKASYFKQLPSSITLILLSLRKEDPRKSESSIFSKIERNNWKIYTPDSKV